MPSAAPDPVSLLAEIIAFDSSNLPGNERPCAEYLADYLSEYGFETRVQPLPEDPRRANVIAVMGNPEGKKLLYQGHTDVVPVSGGWASDPFRAEIRDGKLYGRGASDMKSGVAAMAAAGARLANDGFDFAGGQLQLLFVCDEELYSKGTRHYIASEDFLPADYAVISEPTAMSCCVAGRGVTRYTLSVLGSSCHASVPEKGVNALAMAGHAILALDRLDREISRRKHPILPSPSLSPTVVEGGTKDNIIPNRVDIKMDRRTLPGETMESCREEIVAALDETAAAIPGFAYRLEPYVSVNAASIPADHELVGICGRVHERMFGATMPVRDFDAWSEQCFFVEAGIPTVVIGPAGIDQAHTVDEYVDVGELRRCTDYFYELAKEVLR